MPIIRNTFFTLRVVKTMDSFLRGGGRKYSCETFTIPIIILFSLFKIVKNFERRGFSGAAYFFIWQPLLCDISLNGSTKPRLELFQKSRSGKINRVFFEEPEICLQYVVC